MRHAAWGARKDIEFKLKVLKEERVRGIQDTEMTEHGQKHGKSSHSMLIHFVEQQQKYHNTSMYRRIHQV